MAKRAELQQELVPLARRTLALKRRLQKGVPDLECQVRFMLAALGLDRCYQLEEAVEAKGAAAVGEAVAALTVAPAAQALQARVVRVFQGIAQWDSRACGQELQRLREELQALVTLRASKWSGQREAQRLYPPASAPEPSLWQVLELAGEALACAQQDLWQWWLGQAGWREYQQAQGRGDDESQWQQEVAQHALPEHEARIVDRWPVPPMEQWPEGRERRQLTQ